MARLNQMIQLAAVAGGCELVRGIQDGPAFFHAAFLVRMNFR